MCKKSTRELDTYSVKKELQVFVDMCFYVDVTIMLYKHLLDIYMSFNIFIILLILD